MKSAGVGIPISCNKIGLSKVFNRVGYEYLDLPFNFSQIVFYFRCKVQGTNIQCLLLQQLEYSLALVTVFMKSCEELVVIFCYNGTLRAKLLCTAKVTYGQVRIAILTTLNDKKTKGGYRIS